MPDAGGVGEGGEGVAGGDEIGNNYWMDMGFIMECENALELGTGYTTLRMY